MSINNRFVTLLIFVLAFLCFWNVLGGDFVVDDRFTIVEHELIKSFSTLPKLFISNYWGDHYPNGLYRPLTSLTYAFNYFLNGLNPWGYHLVNILLHIANSLMIYWLVNHYSQINKLALFTAIIFTVHPIHTEAVSNISGRAELLTANFALLSWISYLLSKENSRYYPFSLAFYFLSLIAKESGITLIGVLILSDLCKDWKNWILQIKSLLKAYSGYLALALIYLLIRFLVLNNLGVPETWLYWRNIDFTTRFFTMSLAFTKYFQLLILPINLAGDYDFSQIPKTSSLNLSVVFSLSLIASIFCLGCWLIKRERFSAFAILFFFVTMSLVSNIFIPTGILMAERLLYFPSISICLLIALALYSISNYNKYLSIILCLIFVISSIAICYKRNIDWLNSRNYIESLVRVAPSNTKAIGARALIYAGEGNFLLAEKELKRAIDIAPSQATPKGMLGNVYYLQGRYDEALDLFNQAIKIFPKEDPAQSYIYLNLARIYHKRKDYPQSIKSFRRAIELSLPDALLNQELAVILAESGNLNEAKTQLEKAIELKPNFAEAQYNLAIILTSLNKPQEALKYFYLATLSEPNNIITYNFYGKALLNEGQFQEAANEFLKAINLAKTSEPKNILLAELYNNLGVAYSQLQRYNEALQEFEKALEVDQNYINASKNLASLKERLKN
ncbi:MAG: tetratricopeptide repeat protein [Acidobacteria bacterium]|nr:tetratricopeptide repeat protein [Acidobacteriota bacterium]